MVRMSRAAFLAAALLLSACGGSGGGGVSAPAPAPQTPASPPPPQGTNTVSGPVLADPILVADDDTADPAQNKAPNDTLENAQPISDEAEIRGHVSCPLPTVPGTFCGTGADEDDIFVADLIAGQTLSLFIFDFSPQTADDLDLDLYLYDETGALISASLDYASQIEQVTVPQTRRYFIDVNAFAGSSNYALTVTAPSSTTEAKGVTLARMAADRLTLTGPLPRSAAKRLGLDKERPGRAGHAMIGRGRIARPEHGPLSRGFSARTLGTEASPEPFATEEKLALLAEIKTINREAGKRVAHPYSFPAKHAVLPPPDSNLQWNLPAIDWQEALTRAEAEVSDLGRPVIAVLDSGIYSSHPEIAPVLIDERDFVPSFIDGDGFDAEAEDEARIDSANPDECFDFHGTHVSSIALAPRGVTTIGGRNMVGALPFADLMAIKLGYSRDPRCQLIVGDVANAIRYAAGLPNITGLLPPRPADVINLSFGGPDADPATREAIEEAVAAGVIVVASAGNDGEEVTPAPSFPASFPEVFAVAATDIQDQHADYSSFYPQVEISAPGGDARFDLNADSFADAILGAVARPNDANTAFEPRYALYQGTSMASPHVAAGFALMKAIYPALTSEEAHRLTEEGLLTRDIGLPGRDNRTGFGLMSLEKMVDVALQLRRDALDLPADFRLEPAAISLGNIEEKATFEIIPVGEPDFSITSVTLASRSIGLGPLPVPVGVEPAPFGFGTFEITIDRAALLPGEYVAEVVVEASDGEQKLLPVSFRVPPSSLIADTAPARVRLERALPGGGFSLESSATLRGGAGERFDFTGLEAGDYRLRITTDMDGDGGVCDPGELGGSFPGRDCDSTATFPVPGTSSTEIEAVLRRLGTE